MEIVTQIVEILVAGLTQMASGIGSGLNDLVESVFLSTADATTTLSIFGSVIIAFGGVALAIGLSKFIVNWLTSWGK